MKYYFKSKSKKYLLATILLLSLCPILGLTYSSFIFSSDNYRASEMYIGSLMYGIKINDESVSKITVAPGETEVNVEITSLNTVSSFYKLIYKENSNILVEYNKETQNLPSGDISNTRRVTVKITNSSSSNIKVEFDIASGYITNNLDDIKIKTGYKEVKDFYEVNKTDIHIALKIDGETVSSLPEDKYYKLSSYVCENGSTVEYDTLTKIIHTFTRGVPEKCTLEFVEADTIGSKILADNPIIKDDNANLFANIADEASESGLFRTTLLDRNEDFDGDDIGEEVLYFRGIVENNYVLFANFCWRILRTNESGKSIKLFYGGAPIINNEVTTCPQTGTGTGIYDTGYVFNPTNTTDAHKYVSSANVDSNAKTIIDTWYLNNIETKGEKITSLIIDEPYCNDSTYVKVSGGSNAGDLNFNSANREDDIIPQFKCPLREDKYTMDVNKGNGKLSKPIALLTGDEAVYAGYRTRTNNASAFLNTAVTHITMSPNWSSGGTSNVTFTTITTSGAMGSSYSWSSSNYFPVISISTEAIVGDNTSGTYGNPYVIVIN